MGNDVDICEMCDELMEFSGIEGTEVGEMWLKLADMWCSGLDYIGDDKFESALKEVIEREYRYLKENYKIVEKKIDVKQKCRYLEPINM